MNFDLEPRTILLVISGSRAYNLYTPESDIDFRGVAVASRDVYHGFLNSWDQTDSKSHMEPFRKLLNEEELKLAKNGLEGAIYNIKKFFFLAANSNPNVLDILFCRDEEVKLQTFQGKLLRDNRNLFLSKRIKFTLSGYACSQLNRIKLHRSYLLSPPLKQPERKDFGLPENRLIAKNKYEAVESAIQKQMDKWELDLTALDASDRIYVSEQINKTLSELQISKEDRFELAAKTIGLEDNYIEIIIKEREFKGAMDEWHKYNEWKRNRNPKRAALEAKWGIDCYVEETEFLTNSGWKTFDQISKTDKLATVYVGDAKFREFLGVEYQNYSEKFDGLFNGNLINLYGNHTDVLVTPNHRMFIRKEERKSKKRAGWSLTEADNLPDTFNILRQITPRIKNYTDKFYFDGICIKPEDYLKLMGWYLSEGSMNKHVRNDGSVRLKSIRLSQKKGGRLHSQYSKFSTFYNKISKQSVYYHKPDKFHAEGMYEVVLFVKDKFIINKIYNECGDIKEKRIPRWVFSLSKWKMEILLDAMLAGDGTFRGDNSAIYYSSVKQLADDFQELAFHCGFETSFYGPYNYTYNEKEIVMHQVHVNKTRTQEKICIRSANIKKIPVNNKRIVCFTVPNGTLITRLNGHIGIHGNCKHAMHLVRLLITAKNVLATGEYNVFVNDPGFLMDIRNGKYSYNEIIEITMGLEKEINSLYETTILPKKADYQKLDSLCISIVESML